ncbi:MAG: hypothetical protein SGJ02_01620 [bacterium]|nr:hypothetical protein [bacterium]
MTTPIQTFNRNLSLSITLIGLALVLRLILAAAEHNNWRGMIISTIHILIVGVGSYFVIRKK